MTCYSCPVLFRFFRCLPRPSKCKKIKKHQDEVEYLITARSWDYLKGFLGVFATCEEDFVSLIDGMYPTDKPADVSARDSMQLEAQNVFLAVDDLYQVCSLLSGFFSMERCVRFSMERWTRAGPRILYRFQLLIHLLFVVMCFTGFDRRVDGVRVKRRGGRKGHRGCCRLEAAKTSSSWQLTVYHVV